MEYLVMIIELGSVLFQTKASTGHNGDSALEQDV